jgi:hypothetical protein
VPPSPGPTPNLALTYDSGLVDGQTIAENGQASWVGEGWDLQIGYVERSYRPCSQDAAGSALVGDLCWFSQDNATLVFGGQATPLVKDGVNGWRAAKDDGLKIEKLNDTDNNPYLCFPQYHQPNDASQATGFGWFYKYLVSSVTERDLTGSSPDEKTTYRYTNEATSDSALWGHDSNESVQLAYRTWSQWRGYSTVTATKEAGVNAKTVSRNVFHRGMDDDGKTLADGSGMSWFSRRVGLLAPPGTPNLDGAISGQGGKCLDIVNASKVAGTPVHLWDCYGNWSQVWQRGPNRSIRNDSGMCLDIDNWGTANGTELQIWTCTGDWNQVWQPRPDGSLRNPQSNKCVDLSSWGTVNGARVQLWDCTGDWSQVWQPQANQSLVNPQANRCMEIANSATADGTKLWSRRCTGAAPSGQAWQAQANQLWQLQANGTVKKSRRSPGHRPRSTSNSGRTSD